MHVAQNDSVKIFIAVKIVLIFKISKNSNHSSSSPASPISCSKSASDIWKQEANPGCSKGYVTQHYPVPIAAVITLHP